MKSFEELSLDLEYTSENNNLVKEFFEPILSKSIRYDRLSGFFNPRLYSKIFRGFTNFIQDKRSKIRLVVGFLPENSIKILNLNKEDIIKEIGQDFITQAFKADLLEEKNYFKLLGWLIVNNKLEIKLALVKKNNEDILNNKDDVITINNAMFHQKIGIFTDEFDKKIVFSGSNNETPYGWEVNSESFDVYTDWNDLERVKRKIEHFNNIWNNNKRNLHVISLPSNSLKILKSKAERDGGNFKIHLEIINKDIEKNEADTPSSKSTLLEIKDDNNWIVNRDTNRNSIEYDLILRNYQKEAIEEWVKKDYRGIFEMATGSGKTFTAIKGLYKLWNEKKKLFTVIAVPDKFLINQWINNLRNYAKNLIAVSSSFPRWEKKLKNHIHFFKENVISSLIIVVTRHSLSKVIDYLFKNNLVNVLFIADEVHWTGANESMKLLSNFHPEYRLGLSATPNRYFDPDGSDFLFQYFGNVVYRFTIADGQRRGSLSTYEYIPIICELNNDEIQKYDKLTKIMLGIDPDENEKEFRELAIKRAKILKLAESKIPALDKLIKDLKDKNEINKIVIFSEEQRQYREVVNILRNNNMIIRDFVAETSDSDRKRIIYELENEIINAIVSKKCLDQGIDIPSLQIGIFLSSTGNPRQFIQRAGRLIRKDPNKKEPVQIYDLIVTPTTDLSGNFLYDNIIKVEYRRIGYFLKNATEISKLNTFNILWKNSKDTNIKIVFDEINKEVNKFNE